MTTVERTMTATPMQREDHGAQYRENGYVLLRNAVPESFLAGVEGLLRSLVDETITEWFETGLITDTFADLDFASRLFTAWRSAGRPVTRTGYDTRFFPRAVTEYLYQDWIIDLTTEAMDTAGVEALEQSRYRATFPRDETASIPWHQDAQCMEQIADLDFITAWIPLVDVSERNSCLEVARVGPDQATYPAVWSPRSGYVCMLESDAAHLSEVETVRMSRGDVLLVGPRTPHRSLLNRSNRTRWSVDLRYTPRP